MKLAPASREYQELYSYAQKRYKGTLDFDVAFRLWFELPDFKANENIYDVLGKDANMVYNDSVHNIVRSATGFYLEKAFKAMKIDFNDPNIAENLADGNIGTPGRLAKVWVGANTNDDTELGVGRWSKKPRIASFPNTNTNTKIPITKRVDLISNCSHHFITFSTLARTDSYAIISYIPDEYVLGISKLQRLNDWISKRFWLQEDLTLAIYKEICEVARTESVYVKVVNAVHGCEFFRGAQSRDGSFSSEMYGGKFEDTTMREQVDRSI